MEELIDELNRYMNESQSRGNRVIAIEGVRAILKRHQTHTLPRTRDYPTTDEYLQVRELERAYEANRASKLS